MAGSEMTGFGRMPTFPTTKGFMFGGNTVPELPSAFAQPPAGRPELHDYLKDLQNFARTNAPGDPTAKRWVKGYGNALQDGWRPSTPGGAEAGSPFLGTGAEGSVLGPPPPPPLGPLPPEFLPGQLPTSELDAISKFWSPPQTQAPPPVGVQRVPMPPVPSQEGEVFSDPMTIVSNRFSPKASVAARPVASPQTRAIKRK